MLVTLNIPFHLFQLPRCPFPSRIFRPKNSSSSSSSSSSGSPALSIFKPGGDRTRERGSSNVRLGDVDPIELELLSRISGTRRGDTRPVAIPKDEEESGDSEEEEQEERETPRRSGGDRRTRIR